MIAPSTKNFKFQLLLSYLGAFPFIYVLIDIHILNVFFIKILKDFIIFYTLIIFTFIGAIRWSFKNNKNLIEILYGFMPSFISTILIIFYLNYGYQNIFLFLISFFLLLQIFLDFLFSRISIEEKSFFLIIRVTLTTIIIINITYLIFV